MISRLRGIILEKTPPLILLDISGVGYEVSAPMSTYYSLPEIGEEAQLHIYHLIKEDTQALYGFMTRKERSLFKEVLKTRGVGVKAALAILSTLTVTQILQCVKAKDVKPMNKVPGIGPKTAEALLIALQGFKMDVPEETGPLPTESNPVKEAEQILKALGHDPDSYLPLLSKKISSQATGREIAEAALVLIRSGK